MMAALWNASYGFQIILVRQRRRIAARASSQRLFRTHDWFGISITTKFASQQPHLRHNNLTFPQKTSFIRKITLIHNPCLLKKPHPTKKHKNDWSKITTGTTNSNGNHYCLCFCDRSLGSWGEGRSDRPLSEMPRRGYKCLQKRKIRQNYPKAKGIHANGRLC